MSRLAEWTDRVVAELRLPAETGSQEVRDLVLDLTRDVAHGVARPAAPLTSFLVGLEAGRAGGDADAVRAAVARVLALLPAGPDPQPGTAQPGEGTPGPASGSTVVAPG